MSTPRRNVVFLAACQGIFVTGSSLVVAVSALVGRSLAPDARLATLPAGLLFLAAMVTTLPASLLMKRIGRRRGFIAGVLAGGLGAGLCGIAIAGGSFYLFCLGSALLGVLAGAAQYYRFAAADAVSEDQRSRAISLVLAGGVVAAFAGPNLARWGRTALAGPEFLGSYAALAALQVAALLLLLRVDLPPASAEERAPGGRPLARVVLRPRYAVALAGAVVSYGVMNLLMTATPLSMSAHAFAFGHTATVIQWHAVGMFAPSFFSGSLVARYGSLRMMTCGLFLLAASAATNLAGTSIWHYALALAALGVGWNFLFVASSVLLTRTYFPAEKAKAQGFNDLLVFATVTLTATSAGALHEVAGWRAMNLAVLAPIAALAAMIAWIGRRRHAPRPARTAEPAASLGPGS
ncbi:MAG: MFS transporter [Acidobacteriota bacterium]|nr:MFS transporter [Acidobacteriota bacterium]